MAELRENPTVRKALGAVLAVLALIALVALLDIGPCADALSEEEFVAQGDEICAEVHERFRDLQSGEGPTTPGAAVKLTEQLIELAEEERDAVGDLAAPGSLADQVERYLKARDRGIEDLRAGLAAAEDSDPLRYERAQAAVAASQRERFALAKRIGFAECSKPLVGPDELKEQAAPPEPTDPDAPPEVSNPSP